MSLPSTDPTGSSPFPAADMIGTSTEQTNLDAFWNRGLLWVGNAAVFHPRGFALGIEPASDLGPRRLVVFQTRGPIAFDPAITAEAIERFQHAELEWETRWKRLLPPS